MSKASSAGISLNRKPLSISILICLWRRLAASRVPVACLWLVTGTVALRAEEGKLGPTADESAEETDRPGELENPFVLPPGRTEFVNYVVGMNAAAREDEFGEGGSAVFLGTTVRFGVTNRLEGVVTVDSFLRQDAPEEGGAGSTAGLGFATILAKWNFLKDASGDFGVSLAPFVRLPLNRSIAGTSRSESGLIVPFDFDLEGGWEVEGSTSVSRAPEGADDWSTQWENQASLERTLTKRLIAYVELQLESGEGPPAWATEFGLTERLNAAVLIDVGVSLGLGRNSRGRMGYAGVGWAF